MEYREQILTLARTAPLLPSSVAKSLNTNSILAGAMLSEMCSKGLLKTSKLKVGGSPLYYIPGNEVQLLNHLASLNEKDRRTVEKLRAEKIIRQSEADPLTQVSLASIKDFAKPLAVTYESKQETFWKWFELSDQDAEAFIREKLEPTHKTELQPPKTEQLPPKTGTPKPEQQKVLTQEPAAKPTPKETKPAGDFWAQVQQFFSTNNITLLEQSVVKRKLEFDLIIELPSPVGTLSYYCKARSKKRISDADISAAYVQGQIKKLPVIYLTDGEPTKQAHALLSQLKGITLKRV